MKHILPSLLVLLWAGVTASAFSVSLAAETEAISVTEINNAVIMTDTTTIYQFTVEDSKKQPVSLSQTASRCGFTPQYDELEAMYRDLHAQGFEILDFPCNQFGNQAPESDEEYTSFCQLNYKTEFPQMRKLEVNGPNESPLYTWLKAQKGFAGFNPQHKLTPILEQMFDKADPEWRTKSDIKWNFTKFLIDRQGRVVARFEPTDTAEQMLPKIKEAIVVKQ